MKEIEFDFFGANQAKNQLEDLLARMNKEVLFQMEELIQRGPDAKSTESVEQLRTIMMEENEKLKESFRLLETAKEALESAMVIAKQAEATEEIAQERMC